ncbi:MAG: CSN-associated deubiquitinating enzyme Ubp12, partial [Thelocarpon superellum]
SERTRVRAHTPTFTPTPTPTLTRPYAYTRRHPSTSLLPILRSPVETVPRAATAVDSSRSNTSSTKKRKLAPPHRRPSHPATNAHPPPAASTGLSNPPAFVPAQSTPARDLRHPPRRGSSPPPRYLPPHLQTGVVEASRRSSSPAPDPASSTAASSPSAAYAGLSLDPEPAGDMSITDSADGAPDDPHGDAARPAATLALSPTRSRVKNAGPDDFPQRSSSPAVKRPASDLEDGAGAELDEAEVSTHVTDQPSATPGSARSAAVETAGMPSVDEQIAQVTALSLKAPQDGQKGYLVATKWLERVKSRASGSRTGGKIDKDAIDGGIGPVDNTELVAPGNQWRELVDEAGDPFVPLKPEVALAEDYEVFPQQAWDLILRWYGTAPGSPVITRYAHNTNPQGHAGSENILYEFNPPVYTITKVRNDSGGIVTQSLKEAAMPAIRTIASRSESFHHFLTRVKTMSGIDRTTKVRVWRVLATDNDPVRPGILSPAPSRSVSPALDMTSLPASPPVDKLVLDLDAFLSLQDGTQREALDVQDPTTNEKYNGHMDLAMAGLATEATLVLEERVGGPGGGEWVSEAAVRSASGKGVALSVTKNGVTTVHPPNKGKTRSGLASGRASPAPSAGPIMTRGRVRRDGRAIGVCGLSNLGNTCYMNSALQCVRSVEELTEYFRLGKFKAELNPSNPLAHNGDVAKSYAALLDMMYAPTAASSVTPRAFKNTIGRYGPSFSGYGQQDSQEFLGFLLDGLQEDLNRIHKKPYIEKPDSTDEMAHDPAALRVLADRCWDIYKARNDSVIADLFAGTYKSTLVCPVCDKVSITFDPFNNLTLQLPIENVWSKEIYYFPLVGPPHRIMVEMDKHGSIRALKEFVAARVKVEAARLHAAELFKAKFYKVYDDYASVSESIQERDDAAVYELADVPTNYPPPKRKPQKPRSMFAFNYGHTSDDDGGPAPTWESPLADRLLVPLFHRVPRDDATRYTSSHVLTAYPSYVIVPRGDARDLDAILRIVLEKVATMTTRPLIEDEDEIDEDDASTSPDDEDMVVTTAEDADSASGTKVKTDSSEGEDGFVDVSMKDAAEPSSTASHPGAEARRVRSSIRDPKRFIPPELRNLFQMKYFSQPGETVPTGWSSTLEDNKEHPLLESRIPVVVANGPHARAKNSDGSADGSSDTLDEDSDSLERGNNVVPKNASESGDDSEEFPEVQDIEPRPVSASKTARRNIAPGPKHTYSRKGKQSRGATSSEGDDAEEEEAAEDDHGPLIRPGEGIVLDWTQPAYDALFNGTRPDDLMRGCSTWESIELLPDAELDKKRALRSSRRKKGLSLEDCLNEFGKDEILSENDPWYCPRCKEFRRANKKFELWKCPDILIIHLKRFSASRGLRDKIDVLVDFPVEGLDLSDRVAMTEEGKSNVYDLFAVDNHYGGLGGGHYTACARNFIDGNWYDYNDTMASRKNAQQAVTPAAYLLFYRRRAERPLGGPQLEQVMDEARQEAEGTSGSRSSSPAGDGHGLDDSSRTGSSSASHGAGVGLRAGTGGLAGGSLTTTMTTNDGDALPSYSHSVPMRDDGSPNSYAEKMQVDEAVDTEYPERSNVHPLASTSNWSFGFRPGMGMSLGGEGGSDDENLMDGASDKAADGSSRGSRASSTHMADFDDDDDGVGDDAEAVVGVTPTTPDASLAMAGHPHPSSIMPGTFQADLDIDPPLVADEELDEPPVAEVHVEEGEGLLRSD